MDTKLKSSLRPVMLLSALIGLTVVALLLAKDIAAHRAFLDKYYYFSSKAFDSQLTIHFNLIKYVQIENRDYPNWPVQRKQALPRVAELRQYYDKQKNGKASELQQAYSVKISEAQRTGNAEEADRLKKEQYDMTSAAVSSLTRLQYDEIDRYLAYRSQQYDYVKRSLESRSGVFYYSIKNLQTGELLTNIGGAGTTAQTDKSPQPLYSFTLPLTGEGSGSSFMQTMSQYFQQNRLAGTFIIPLKPDGFSQIQADYNYYQAIRERILKEIVLFGIFVLAALLLYAYIRKQQVTWSVLGASLNGLFRRIPLDLRMAIALAALYLLLESDSGGSLFRFPVYAGSLLRFVFICLHAAFVVLQCFYGYRLYRHPEQFKLEWRRGISCRAAVLLRFSLVNKSIAVKLALIFLATVVLGIMAVALVVGIHDGAGGLISFALIYFLLYAGIVVPYALRRMAALGSIMNGAEALAAGSFSYTVDEIGRGHLSRLARDMNSTKLGLMKSLESRLKSERLKSELITNVSHDLKTPLTSIMNYVGLLKDKELPQEKAEQYVEVLDRKTARLKLLIEDLFEASKMASGSVELEYDNVNVSALLNQALAECGEQIRASSCTVKTDIANPKLYARLDGKKTWRVFENLIGNALKYAMPNTRIYISLHEKDDQLVFTIKNVSAYEIDFDADELFERFKRGDKSRHTEGTGLGLAIAKSIVDLQGGQLRLDIDGDYFKATVTFARS